MAARRVGSRPSSTLCGMNGGGEPIRVLLGSTPLYAVSEALFVRSLLATASCPVDVQVIDCGRHVLRRPGSTNGQPLPEAWRGRLGGMTGFSFARYAPPELCGYAGRAIYCEPDQLVLGDIAELWDLPLGGAHLAAVPFAHLRGTPPPYQSSGHLSSVLVFDNARCRSLTVSAILDALDEGALEYADVIAMTEQFVERFGLEVAAMPAAWNDLERRAPDTRLLHFTDGPRRPWVHPGHPENALWRRAFVDAIRAGVLDVDTLDSARRAGEISRRVRLVARAPRTFAASVDATLRTGERLRRRRDHRP